MYIDNSFFFSSQLQCTTLITMSVNFLLHFIQSDFSREDNLFKIPSWQLTYI